MNPPVSCSESDLSSFAVPVPATDTLLPRDYFQSAATSSTHIRSDERPPASPSSQHSGSSSISSTQSLQEASSSSQRPQQHPARPEEQSHGSLVFMQQEHLQSKQESGDGGMPQAAIPDFVRKLYNMLEDKSLCNVLCWGPQGDLFVIKDVQAFTVDILPRTFKHSNFASFVRQLNKYDFHKIKAADADAFGENSWLFRHVDFRARAPELLENITRKVSGARRHRDSQLAALQAQAQALQAQALQAQVQRMARRQDAMAAQIAGMEREYAAVLGGMAALRRGLAQQDGALHELAQYAVQYGDPNGGAVL